MATWTVDETGCVGCVLCSDLAPQLFVYDLAREVVVVYPAVTESPSLRKAAQQAMEACPVDAISVVFAEAGEAASASTCL